MSALKGRGDPRRRPALLANLQPAPAYLVPDPNRTFLARVKGDSMRDAGRADGDLVVVDLQAANPEYADIFSDGEVEVLGVVVGQCRVYRR